MSLCLQPPPNSSSAEIFRRYEQSHPLTVQNFRCMEHGAYWFERLLAIDAAFAKRQTKKNSGVSEIDSPPLLHGKAPTTDYHTDLVYAGGGLGILHAAVMATVYGKKVCVFDRFTAGLTHRDWNISMPELERLCHIGFLSKEELASVIQRRYEHGFISFFNDDTTVQAPPLIMKGVLDVAVHANALLAIARKKLLHAGGEIIDHATFRRVWVGDNHAVTEIMQEGRLRYLQSKVLVDCMGAYSPIAAQMNPTLSFSHCCPTVGAISCGFVQGNGKREVNPNIGEILVTLDHADAQGRQMIWEGFPSAGDEFVSYLFFYDRIDSPADKSLLNLYELFFAKLPEYKQPGKDFDIGRPLFGIIPSMLHRSPVKRRRVATDNVLCLGDAAALSSPLTYCGFGSFVRNLERTTALLTYAVDNNLLSARYLERINAYEASVAIVANFAQYLVGNPHHPAKEINTTMNIISNVLHKLPSSVSEELFRDTLSWKAYNQLMSSVPVYYPQAYSLLFKNGISGAFWWVLNFLGFSYYELKKVLLRSLVTRYKNSTRLSAGIVFRCQALYYSFLERRV